MQNKQMGFILVMVLIFMLILSTISISNLTQIKQNIHIHSLVSQYDTQFVYAKKVLQTLEGTPLARCRIALIPSHDLLRKPITWWQTYGCNAAIANTRYYYVYENLGKDPCAMTADGRSVEYYRLTVVSTAKHVQDSKVFLQSTLVRPTNSHEQCEGQKHIVALGQQTLREF